MENCNDFFCFAGEGRDFFRAGFAGSDGVLLERELVGLGGDETDPGVPGVADDASGFGFFGRLLFLGAGDFGGGKFVGFGAEVDICGKKDSTENEKRLRDNAARENYHNI